MSLFKKVLASVGIGATEIDAVFTKNTYSPGEEASGVVKIKGGKVDQQIDELFMTMYVVAHYETDNGDGRSAEKIQSFTVSRNLQIKAGSYQEVPFSVKIPLFSPKSTSKSPVWFHTGADIPNALDRSDKDYLDIKEHNSISKFLDVMRDMGFRVREVEVERDPRRSSRFYASEGVQVNYIQEYEWSASTEYRSRLDEVEALFLPLGNGGLKVWFTKDKKVRSLSGLFQEAMGTDESTIEFIFSSDDLNNSNRIENLIRGFLG